METPPRRPYVSPPPHPTNTTRPLPPLVRCLFYHPPAPSSSPPFASPPGTRIDPQTSSRSYVFYGECYWQRDRFSLSLSPSLSLYPSPLLFIFLFFPRFFTSLLLAPSVSTPPRGFSLFSPSSSSLFRERAVLFSYSLSTPPSPSASYQESRVIGSRRPVFASTFAARVPSRDLRQRRTSRRVENFFSFDRMLSLLECIRAVLVKGRNRTVLFSNADLWMAGWDRIRLRNMGRCCGKWL